MLWLRRFALPALVLLFAAVPGFGHGLPVQSAHAQAATETHVGRFDTFDAFIGISSDGTDVIAYACDGANNGIANDFKGKVADAVNGVLALQADSGAVLTLNLDQGIQTDGGLSGSLTTADQRVDTFTADAAVLPGALYLANSVTDDGTAAEGGWVVLNNGDVRGSFNLRVQITTQVFAVNGQPVVFGLSANGQFLQQMPSFGLTQFMLQQQALQQQNLLLVQNFRLVTPTTVVFPFTVPTLLGVLGTQQFNVVRTNFGNPFFMPFFR